MPEEQEYVHFVDLNKAPFVGGWVRNVKTNTVGRVRAINVIDGEVYAIVQFADTKKLALVKKENLQAVKIVKG